MSDTQLTSLNIRPGINKNTTSLDAENFWVECDNIRFRSSRAEKIGGYQRETVQQDTDPTNLFFTGVARKALSWNSLDFKKYLAVATHLKVEIMNDGKIYDVTPVRDSDTITDKLTTVDTESEVSIEYTSHSVVVGDYIFIVSQASAIDGITLSGEYQVTEVVDVNNFKVDSGTAATGSTSGGGGDVVIQLLLENGYQSAGDNTGWGGGTWDTEGASGGGWGEPRAGVGGLEPRLWSLANWGEDLIANVRRGGIYQWDETNGLGTRLQILANAPEQNLFVLVSQPSRHLIAFGSEVFSTSEFNPLIIRWASQETLTEWDITASNTAGEYLLPDGNFIVGAVQTRSEIIIFTNTIVYSMRYVGGNDVFKIDPLGTNMSAISQNSFIDDNGIVYWMGIDNFYMYDGVISVLPCSISKFIFNQDGDGKFDFTQKEKVYAGINKEFNEIWFFYPIDGNEENNAYAKYNSLEKVWDYGFMNRTAWIDKSIFEKPYALNTEGRLFIHEIGKDADGQPLVAYIKSGYFDMEDGTDLIFMDRVVPDLKLPSNQSVSVSVTTKKYPHPTARTVVKGPYNFSDNQSQIKLRARGRQACIEIRASSTGGDFELGRIRVGYQPDGGR
jgi:hypothetical protein